MSLILTTILSSLSKAPGLQLPKTWEPYRDNYLFKYFFSLCLFITAGNWLISLTKSNILHLKARHVCSCVCTSLASDTNIDVFEACKLVSVDVICLCRYQHSVTHSRMEALHCTLLFMPEDRIGMEWRTCHMSVNAATDHLYCIILWVPIWKYVTCPSFSGYVPVPVKRRM